MDISDDLIKIISKREKGVLDLLLELAKEVIRDVE